MKPTLLSLLALTVLTSFAQAQTNAPVAERKPSDGPFPPQMIAKGGTIIPLYKPDSPLLKRERIHEAEKYNTQGNSKGPIINVINIHNPSIEVHLASDRSKNGAAMIIAPGGGHKILWVGPEGADYVETNDKLGISTIILRNRLRVDGYEPTTDAVNDAFQAIRIVRAHAAEWNLDPNKIGIVGFSAGAELSAPTAVFFEEFAKKNSDPADPLAKVSARPDFVGVIYPGPTPFTKAPETAIPATVPPSFIACAGTGDKGHAIWAADYFNAMLKANVPNLEMHIYGRGVHAVKRSNAPDAIPYAKWFDRYIEWFTDLGFLDKPGVETKAAKEVAAYAKKAKK
jgi:endo-1,4-beta-xylanase